MTSTTAIDDVTCLGCGCACDDVRVVVEAGRIVGVQNACALGAGWFGDSEVPSRITVDGRDATLDDAIAAASTRLRAAARPLVYLGLSISCEAQRAGVAVADILRARVDSVTSATTLPLVLAAQERGFASSTLGEIRNRADVVVFWGVDVERRYPRFASRYVPEPIGTHVPDGRRGRRVIAIDVGAAQTTVADVDHRFAVPPAGELAVLTALQALVRESPSMRAIPSDGDTPWHLARAIAAHLLSGRYVALVFDAEPDERAVRSPQRFDAILALSQALNERTRGAAVGLRAGGNRSGADSVFTAHTGFPVRVDFERGIPRFDPYGGSTRATDVALVIGDASLIPRPVADTLAGVQLVVIGPRASESPLGSATVTIDTGVAGIHSAGTAFRVDDVPLSLRAPLRDRLSAADVISSLARHVAMARRQTSRTERASAR